VSNLIITIISIALVAVVALVGIFYGGQIYESYQINAMTNTLLSEAKQLNGALQAYEASNPGETVSVIMTSSGQGDAIAPQCGGFASVIRAGFLSQLPSVPNGQWPQDPNICNQNSVGRSIGSARILNCFNYQGNYGFASITPTNYTQGDGVQVILDDSFLFEGVNGGNNYASCSPTTNSVMPSFGLEDASYTNHPLVQICKTINKILGTVPPGTTLSASGLPPPTAGNDSNVHPYCRLYGNFGNPPLYGIMLDFIN